MRNISSNIPSSQRRLAAEQRRPAAGPRRPTAGPRQPVAGQQRSVTGHWIGDRPVLPGPADTRNARNYMLGTNMNMQHGNMETFLERADNYADRNPHEQAKIQRTQQAHTNRRTPEFKQSAHMLHVQRADYKLRNEDLMRTDRQHYGEIVDDRLDKHSRRDPLNDRHDPEYARMIEMVVKGKEGPMTLRQSTMGVEAAVAGHKDFHRLRNYESHGNYHNERVSSTNRQGHVNEPTGVDLTQDPDSINRRAGGQVEQLGTSGSSSDALRSHLYAADNVDHRLPGYERTHFEAPGVSTQDAIAATKDNTFTWFKTGGPAQNISQAIDDTLRQQGNRVSGGGLTDTQTHSYSEVRDAIDWTLEQYRR